MKNIQSWGRLSQTPHELIYLSDTAQILSQFKRHQSGIPFGMGRSYGDVCLNPKGKLWATRGLDKFINFNPESGRLICQSGVLLKDIQHLLVPRGWSLPVTPGSLWVTVGGAIANDIHGKNHHHFGTFGEHVCRLRILRTNGEIIECGPELHPAWFAATVGGIGLTGLILDVELQLRRLKSPWLETELIPFSTLDEFFFLTNQSAIWEHTVAWIDCTQLGRGIFLRANFIDSTAPYTPAKPRGVPKGLPFSLVNDFTLRPLNAFYYHHKKGQSGRKKIHYEQFLYPLDHLSDWNRLYGPKGFYQYQVVLPEADSQDALQALLMEIKRSNQGSCLAVLKTFSQRPSVGMMSFVKPGITLAIDFANRGEKTKKLLARLDTISCTANGRLYLAKDACMSGKFFEKSYPSLSNFLQYRDVNMSSGLSRRLGIG